MSLHRDRASLTDLPWETVERHGQFLRMQSNWHFDLVPSGFTPTYTENARDTRVEEFARQEHPLLFNGPTLCLESIDPKTRTVSISKGEFYDFLFSNILSLLCRSAQIVSHRPSWHQAYCRTHWRSRFSL